MSPSRSESRLLGAFDTTKTRVGPLIAAVDSCDSVLRVSKSLSTLSPNGVLAVSMLPPLALYDIGVDPIVIAPQVNLQRKAAHRDRLLKKVAELVGPDPAFESRVIYDDPASGLVELAATTNSPLIVMGIGRHNPLERLVGAETALRTVRRAPCPVLAVAPNTTAPMRSVVVATDFSVRSARAAEAVLPLLAPDATVYVLRVWEQIELLGGNLEVTPEAQEIAIRERFRHFIETLPVPRGVTVRSEQRTGRPAKTILAFADEVDADLIVVGRQGRGALATLLTGSVTQALLRASRRSVFVAPEPSYADEDRLSRFLTGASASSAPEKWPTRLEAFTRRNAERRTVLEVDEVELGAQVQERGYRFIGAAYDPHDDSIELMLGGGGAGTPHITRRISNVDSLTIAADRSGKDIGMSISYRVGRALLTFLPD